MINDWVEATIDFTKPDQLSNWRIVNDGVMGGLSQGKIRFDDEGMIFSGYVSLENNGGFTSFRSPYQRMDLSGFETIEIKYKSSGLDCALSFDQYTRFWRPNHKLKLPVSPDWTTIKVPLNELKQYRMGDATGEQMDTEALANTIRLGFITDSKKAGDFVLHVAYVKFAADNK